MPRGRKSQATAMTQELEPLQKTLDVIGAKWTVLIIRDLISGTKRFGELLKSLGGVSPKTLSERLKDLEDAGIVKRQIFAEIPPRVEYSLSEKGRTLSSIIDEIRAWGERWLPATAESAAATEQRAGRGRRAAAATAAPAARGRRKKA